MQNEKPVHHVRFGVIQGAVWRHENDKGPWYSVTFNRSYKDGLEWKTSDSFGRDDLLVLAKVADQAHTWICERGREDNAERPKQAATKH